MQYVKMQGFAKNIIEFHRNTWRIEILYSSVEDIVESENRFGFVEYTILG